MQTQLFTTQYGGRKFKIEIGHLAQQANGAVLAQYGDTSVLVTATMSAVPREVDYLPLTVDYLERYYSAGKIKGSRWIKRETRPSDGAILAARLIDRTIRPRFDQRIRNEIQVIATVLSYDGQNDPAVIAIIGASLALGISSIPFAGPIAASKVGFRDNQLALNPSEDEVEQSGFELVVSGTKERINMLEAGLPIIPDSTVLEAIEFGFKKYQHMIEFQNEILKKLAPPKTEFVFFEPPAGFSDELHKFWGKRIEQEVYQTDRQDMYQGLNDLKQATFNWLREKYQDTESLDDLESIAGQLFEKEIDLILHQNILQKEKRPDGRKLDEIRALDAQVALLPRVHGSALFERGATQALSILTLAAPGAQQWIETPELETKKRFMHHYNFPPFSSGEVGRVGFTGRREIGHGYLAERALSPILPSKEEFPYTMRVVSEILSSNGSTSMASACATSLALMDGGVPIKQAVSGIAMGIVTSLAGEEFKILTDIQGPEDHHGDMDLKIAGTATGLTALQMDTKIEGINLQMLSSAFTQGRKAIDYILKKMSRVLAEPRKDISEFAPRIYSLRINPDKIRLVIGPQGKTINEIINQTGTEIDIEQDGTVFITSPGSSGGAERALEWIKNLTREVKPDELYEGRITRVMDFGAFIEVLPGQEGLLHISEFNRKGIRNIKEAVKVGERMKVKIKSIDELGRINLLLADKL